MKRFADLIFPPDCAAECVGRSVVAEDQDSRCGLVRRQEVVSESERRAPVDPVDVEDLLMTAFERSRPIQPVRFRRLSALRGWSKADQAERRHAGNTAEEAAAGRIVGRTLILTRHLFLHRVSYAGRCAVRDRMNPSALFRQRYSSRTLRGLL